MNDERLDALIESALPETPPDDAAGGITPWRKAMAQVLWGIGLCAVTLNFLALNYILPAVGAMLMLCGFRTLRRENRCFAWLYAVSALRAAIWVFTLASLCTIYSSAPAVERVSSALTCVSVAAQLVTPLLLFGAIRGVQAKAGVKKHAAGAIWLLVWYSIVLVLGLYGAVLGLLGGILFIAAFVLIIRSLYKLYSELDEAGYAVTAAPGRVSNRAMTIALTGITLALMLCGYLFFTGRPMDWQEQSSERSRSVEEVSDRLEALGVTEDVLNDMSDEDILACDGAFYCVTGLLWAGPEDSVFENMLYRDFTLFLPGNEYRVIHYFVWRDDPGPFVAEAIDLMPTWGHMYEAWRPAGETTGRVLYDSEGRTFASPYTEITNEYINGNYHVILTFDFPNSGERQRGYVTYASENVQTGWLFNSWFNYGRLASPLIYPFMDPADLLRSGAFGVGVYQRYQNAAQFYPSDYPNG